ncbi:phosphonopyruvate decarboxylase [Ensifer sp. ENS05]|uniref:phosphonopyruvate decarboxylase n=1 Tax=Ensifer sp. ENS05 TaxID=2769277 RepID=UPI0017859885|nr:phosphonopyruvate decarboxylase [Ensifer sp. ENS05]MBD9598131.1 phosphonopyruvate decarboxylase [Ensifer sp. ENS05]
MIGAESWGRLLTAAGYDFATGVPCSSLSPLQNVFVMGERVEYIAATNEGQAIAIAAGARIAGRKSVVLMQNSGLGNAINPITSLLAIFEIPLLLIVSWRGRPGWPDEPQHEVMGRITPNLLQVLDVPYRILSEDPSAASADLTQVLDMIETTGRTHAIIVPDKTFVPFPCATTEMRLREPGLHSHEGKSIALLPSRTEALERINATCGDDLMVATTGKTARELFALGDKPRNLYVVGSMGLASSLALGLSLVTDERVIAIDGDGAALMHLGAISTIATYGRSNFVHVILDNGCYDSTGAQPSTAANTPFAEVAALSGYRKSWTTDNIDNFSEILARTRREAGPLMIRLKIAAGSPKDLPRPDRAPKDVLKRLQETLAHAS